MRAESGHINVTPFGFHQYASDFLQAARPFPRSSRFSPAPYYLLYLSIELSLKAFLLTRGATKTELKRNLGHDLDRLLARAKSSGLEQHTPVSPYEEQIQKANEYYNKPTRGFEYFDITTAVTGCRDLPDLFSLDELASQLVSSLKSVCLNAA